MAAQRDRVTVRRALKAGSAVGLLFAVPLGVAAGFTDPRLVLAAVFAGLTAGALLSSAWLLLAGVLDVSAGEFPGRRRLAVTATTVLLALVAPFLLLAALTPR